MSNLALKELSPCPPSPRGRPKDMAKRQAILDAAQKIFLEKGFSKSCMSDIAFAAGVSKLTLYSHFTDKQALFICALEDRCFHDLSLDVMEEYYYDLPAHDALVKLGRAMLDVYLSERSLTMYRLMLAEYNAHPKLAKIYVDTAMGGMTKRIVVVLQYIAEQGDYVFPHLRRAAMHFYVLAKGNFHARMLFDHQPVATNAEQDAHLSEAAALFLRAHKI